MKKVFAYCLFCETQRCRIIAGLITKNYGYTCLSPQIIQRKWVRGVPREEIHDWLPGYVFLYTEDRIVPRFNISGIVRILGNGELSGNDLAFAEMIHRRNGVMGSISLVQEGEHCIIKDPAWNDLQGTVIKMDHGRQRCCVAFEFDGVKRTIWAGYDIVKSEP